MRCTADELRIQAQAWAVFLDPDGAEPADDRAMRRRGFRLGRARDGLIPVTGDLMPEIAGKLTRLFDAYLSPRSGGGFQTADERAEAAESGEQRTADQHRHDVLAAIIDTAARSGEHPSIGGAAPTALVSVRQSDLTGGTGVAHADGIDIPISLRAAKHMICTGGTQRVTFDDHGRIIALGSPERCFTPHQRRAITLRDGGCLDVRDAVARIRLLLVARIRLLLDAGVAALEAALGRVGHRRIAAGRAGDVGVAGPTALVALIGLVSVDLGAAGVGHVAHRSLLRLGVPPDSRRPRWAATG